MIVPTNRNTSTTVWPPSFPSCCPPQPVVWTYNASGEVTHDHNKTYTYDAAGDKVKVAEVPPETGTTFVHKLWIYQDYDADGERVKRVEQTQVNQGAFSFTTSYYVRSSVLDDKIVRELDQNGAKRKTYVYAGGTVLARQEKNQVRWEHSDPVTNSLRETGADGSTLSRAEFDPLGNDAPLTDPHHSSQVMRSAAAASSSIKLSESSYCLRNNPFDQYIPIQPLNLLSYSSPMSGNFRL